MLLHLAYAQTHSSFISYNFRVCGSKHLLIILICGFSKAVGRLEMFFANHQSDICSVLWRVRLKTPRLINEGQM